MINNVNIAGNLTRAPELKTLPSGTTVVNFGLAVTERRKQGEDWIDVPHFFDCTYFGRRAEIFAGKATQGDLCFVSGRLSFRQWEGTDGSKRNKVEIVVEDAQGQFQYKKADEAVTPASSNGSAPEPVAASPAAADDDIPF